ncbi:HNH endonuclease domain-containing protein [Mycoplasma procyoni]|uniref:HNH endonuclease domain-containing protein n=1 Tax=Mycoplasma procyoni TaxID=568784 RepID=UPI00197C2AE1|nr:HNH endonuclease domain-containing protein [Mycoplasma procyoni]MBN3534908.1 hypothetical protein [Mycoplasma procyoni]
MKKFIKTLWLEQCGDEEWCEDFAGRLMNRANYWDSNSNQNPGPYSFNLDHIYPQSKFAKGSQANYPENLILVNVNTNDEKADKTVFKANGKHWEVRKSGISEDGNVVYDIFEK